MKTLPLKTLMGWVFRRLGAVKALLVLFALGIFFLARASVNAGTGADGNLAVTGSVFNLNTNMSAGRTQADGINWAIGSGISSGTTSLTLPGLTTGLAAGDELLIIDQQATSAAFPGSVGTYEFVTVQSVSGTSVTISATTKNYSAGNKVVVQRVPNYNNVTLSSGASLTASAWNGSLGGIVAFRAAGTLTVDATSSITAKGLGYRGGAGATSLTVHSKGGESWIPTDATTGTSFGEAATTAGTGSGGGGDKPSSGGPGGIAAGGGGSDGTDAQNDDHGAGGGGGSHGGGGGGGAWGDGCGGGTTKGYPGGGVGVAPTNGISAQCGSALAAPTYQCDYSGASFKQGGAGGNGLGSNYGGGGGGGGGIYGSADLSTIFLGGGGGGGGGTYEAGLTQRNGTAGGNGGGIIYIEAATVNLSGSIDVSGASAGTWSTGWESTGGGGAGGSLHLNAGTLSAPNLSLKINGAPPQPTGSTSAPSGIPGGGGGGGEGRYVVTAAGFSAGMIYTNVSSGQIPMTGTGTCMAGSTVLRGHVFEDVTGNGIAGGETVSTGDQRPIAGATVRLWLDSNSNGLLDTGDAAVITLTTVSDGSYQASVQAGRYFVTVDAPTSNGGSTLAGILGEQTYASSNATALSTAGAMRAFCAQGTYHTAGTPSTAAVMRSGSGTCYGGRYPLGADVANSVTGAKHVMGVTVGTSDVTGVDFGFSFNVVTNTNLTGQGSVTQFVVNANAITSNSGQGAGAANQMYFVPATCVNDMAANTTGTAGTACVAGTNTYWKVSNPTIAPLTDPYTTLDGRAYSYTDGVTLLNPNNVTLGTGGTVGTTATALAQLNGPELDLYSGALTVSAANTTIQNLALGGSPVAIAQTAGNNLLVQNNLIGSTNAKTYTGASGGGISLKNNGSTDTATIRNNLFYIAANNSAITTAGKTSGATVQGNEFKGVGYLGHIYLPTYGLVNANITSNLFNAATYADLYDVSTGANAGAGVTVQNNTFASSGTNYDEVYLATASTGYVLTQNIFTNAGAGTSAGSAGVSVAGTTQGVKISQNSFYGNGANGIDLANNGVTANTNACSNANGTGTATANGSLARPVITGATLSGSNVTVTGTLCATGQYTVELYAAQAGSGDGTGLTTAGEGKTYLGAQTGITTGTFSITVPSSQITTGLVTAIALRETATGGTVGDTSEFAQNMVVGVPISGTVFEDVTGDGVAGGETTATGDQRPLVGVTVRLWQDTNANGVLDTGDLEVATTVTDASGNYSFSYSGTLFVTVDAPKKNGGVTPSGIVGEQTYAGASGTTASPLCDRDGEATWPDNLITTGSGGVACYGGRNASLADCTIATAVSTTVGTALPATCTVATATGQTPMEHVTKLNASATAITGVNFGFSFNVVTNTNTTGQGSVTQFVTNANTITSSSGQGSGSANLMRFVPASCKNDMGGTCLGTSTYWKVTSAAIPALTDPYTTLDGTAYSNLDGTTPVNPNNVTLGTGGTVGTTATALAQLNAPELEFYASPVAVSAANTTIQNLALDGSGTAISQTAGNSLLVQNNLIGSTNAKSYTSAVGGGISLKNNGSTDSVIVRNNLFYTQANYASITTAGKTSGVTIQGNQFSGGSYLGHIYLPTYGLAGASITGNRFNNSNYYAYYESSSGTNAGSGVTVQNNTFASSAAGYDLVNLNTTSTGYVFTRNIFTNAGGGANASSAGIALANNTNPQGVKISQNSFYGNGGNAIDLGDNGVTANTNACSNTNGTGTATANGSLARPTISAAGVLGGGTSLVVSGTLCGTGQYTVEFYKVASGTASGDGTPQAGEGAVYLGSLSGQTGGVFSGTLSGLGGSTALAGTDRITAIAIRETATGGTLGDTSEFSANVALQTVARVTVRKFVDGALVRASTGDQFTISTGGAASAYLGGVAPAAQSTSCTGTTTTSCGGSSTPAATISGFYAVAGQSITLTDMMKSGSTSPLSYYRTDLTCSATRNSGASGAVTTTMGASGTGTTLSATPATTTVAPTGTGSAMNSTWTLIPGADDDIVCDWHNVTSIPPRITLTKALRGARLASTDQFTVQVKNGATVVNDTTNATSTGTGSTITAGTGQSVPLAGTPLVSGTTYTLTEVASGTTSLASYTGSISCTNGNAGSATVLPTGTGQSFTLTPVAGDDISCTLTNAPPPRITLTKALAAVRALDSDQFIVQVMNGATVVNDRTGELSTGSGSTVTAGTGTSVPLASAPLSGGTTYTLVETAAGTTNLPFYAGSIACTNTTAGSSTTLPWGSGQSFTLTPAAGDDISCTLSNQYAPPPRVTLYKRLSGNRAFDADQFALAVKDSGGTNLSTTPARTTAGAGSAITAGTGTTGTVALTKNQTYTLDEVMAAGSTSALTDYAGSLSCTNNPFGGSSATVLPSGNGRSFSFTPVGDDDIVCTLTNTSQVSRLTLVKSVTGSPARVSASDQFTVAVSSNTGAGTTSLPATPNATTSGSSTTNAATLGAFRLVSDGSTTYTLTDSMAAGSASTLGLYKSSLVCSVSNSAGPVTTVGNEGTSLSGSAGPLPTGSALVLTPTGSGAAMQTAYTLRPGLGDQVVCTFENQTNTPRVTVSKLSVGGTGAFSFSGTANGNGFGSDAITTTAANTATAGVTKFLTAPNTLTEIQETLPAGWTLTSASCRDANAANTGNTAGVIGVVSANVLSIPAANALAGADLQCTFTNTYTGFGLTGRVILDTGAGGGTAHDGEQNGAERGQAGVAVSLTNCGSTGYSSTTTNASGDFTLGTAGASGAVCVVRTLPAGYQAVSGNAGTTGGSYTQATDRIGFTLAAGSIHSGLVFGGVPQSTFTTDGVKQVAPGQSAIYSHLYTAGSSATVSIATSEAPTPAGLNWVTVLYVDSDCNGELGAGDTLITGSMSVTAGQSVCILARVNSPAGAAEGSRDVTTVTLSEVLSPVPQGGAVSRVMTHTDTTTVAQTGLTLSKQVRKVTACPATAAASLADGTVYTTSNNARPGDYLEYLLSYRNDAGMPVTAVRVADTTPAYTRFRQALCLSTPAVGLSGCAVTTQPALDATGSVLWTLTDAATAPVGLQPGAAGSVSYCVQVVP